VNAATGTSAEVTAMIQASVPTVIGVAAVLLERVMGVTEPEP